MLGIISVMGLVPISLVLLSWMASFVRYCASAILLLSKLDRDFERLRKSGINEIKRRLLLFSCP